MFFNIFKKNKTEDDLEKAFENEAEEVRKIVRKAAPMVDAAIKEQREEEERKRIAKEEKANLRRIKKIKTEDNDNKR